ncbi:hypothetical protein AB1Y20_022746 [Prymnesium parvum]|uniref:Uncharacterized protein n=1 Tax=Prymnesium parvum TaxID=97485 RepID=A0AB34JI20_PRYPA
MLFGWMESEVTLLLRHRPRAASRRGKLVLFDRHVELSARAADASAYSLARAWAAGRTAAARRPPAARREAAWPPRAPLEAERQGKRRRAAEEGGGAEEEGEGEGGREGEAAEGGGAEGAGVRTPRRGEAADGPPLLRAHVAHFRAVGRLERALFARRLRRSRARLAVMLGLEVAGDGAEGKERGGEGVGGQGRGSR